MHELDLEVGNQTVGVRERLGHGDGRIEPAGELAEILVMVLERVPLAVILIKLE
jgi:hypothetical protein